MTVVSLLVSCLVNAAWQVIAVAAAGWLATRALKKLGPRAEHIGWVVTLGVAVVTPAGPFLQILFKLLSQPGYARSNVAIALAPTAETARGLGMLHQWPAAVLWLFAAAYCGVLLYFAGRTFFSLYRVRLLVRDAKPLSLTAEQQEIWSRCRRSFGLHDARLLSSPSIPGPVAAGLREPVLIVPAEFTTRCTAPDLLAALAHECAHARRHDFQKNLVYEASSLVLAFHPAIWLIKAQIAQTREMICDGLVAERVIEPRAYAQSLLRLAAMVAVSPQVSSAHAIGIFDANILEKRVMMMNRKQRHSSRIARYALVIPAALFLVFTGMVAAAKSVVIEPQAAAGQSAKSAEDSSAYGPVYKVGKDVTAPVIAHVVDAEFPASERKSPRPFQAVVIVHLIVDKEGAPRDVRIARSYNADFDAQAIKAVKQYRFQPAKRSGAPVAVAVNVEVNFKKY